jgi:hypothetical protein
MMNGADGKAEGKMDHRGDNQLSPSREIEGTLRLVILHPVIRIQCRMCRRTSGNQNIERRPRLVAVGDGWNPLRNDVRP